MATTTYALTVNPETLAAGEALAGLVAAAKKGGLAGAIAALPDIIPLITAIPQIPAEAQSNPVAEVSSVFVVGQLVYGALTA